MIVLDASLMVARILREPHGGLDQDIFTFLDANQVIVPCHWSTEIANALRTNIRRGRLVLPDLLAVTALLSKLEVTISAPIQLDGIGGLTQFAIAQGLTAYDAAYVRVALDHGAQLATLDSDMRASARRLDIPLLPA